MCYLCDLKVGKPLMVKLMPEIKLSRKESCDNITNNSDIKMNEVGKRIWTIIETPIEINNIIKILINEYDVELNECRDNVLTFLSQLNHIGLVNIHG